MQVYLLEHIHPHPTTLQGILLLRRMELSPFLIFWIVFSGIRIYFTISFFSFLFYYISVICRLSIFTKNAAANSAVSISHSTTVAYKLFFFDIVQECHFCILASTCPKFLFFVFAQVFAQTHLIYRFLLFFHTVPESSRILRS